MAMFNKKLIISTLLIMIFAVEGVYATGDPARGNELHAECSDCHGEDGLGDEEYPRLAGLDEDYLLEQMMLIQKGERSEEAEMMLWFFEDLEEQDLADLAAYYASLENN
jgi:cytochrome c553